MSKPIIVLDPGSTWVRKMDYGFKLIELAKEAGADCVKFQLFKGKEYTDAGNIEIAFDQFEQFYKHGKIVGMPVTASVFNKEALEFLLSLGDLHHIKFAYSQRTNPMIGAMVSLGKRVVVTTNVHDAYDLPKDVIKLVTQPRCKHADEYAILTKMNFDGLFPSRFQGFSDHSLGYLEAQSAVQNRAVWIEKHFRLGFDDCLDVPDGRFALGPDQIKEFCWKVK